MENQAHYRAILRFAHRNRCQLESSFDAQSFEISMSLKQSEAIVLRTYPLREADLLVTLFTRAEGKVKGVARVGQEVQAAFWRSAWSR